MQYSLLLFCFPHTAAITQRLWDIYSVYEIQQRFLFHIDASDKRQAGGMSKVGGIMKQRNEGKKGCGAGYGEMR